MPGPTVHERVAFPLQVKQDDLKREAKPKAEIEDIQLKDLFEIIIEHVHGSQLTKKELAKELQEKLPQMRRKAGKIQEFLTTYCTRGRQNDEDGQVMATAGSKQKPGSQRQSN